VGGHGPLRARYSPAPCNVQLKRNLLSTTTDDCCRKQATGVSCFPTGGSTTLGIAPTMPKNSKACGTNVRLVLLVTNHDPAGDPTHEAPAALRCKTSPLLRHLRFPLSVTSILPTIRGRINNGSWCKDDVLFSSAPERFQPPTKQNADFADF